MTEEGTAGDQQEGPLDRLKARSREVFLCEEALTVLRLQGEDARRQLRASLALGRQRTAAGAALFSRGHGAEGLRLLVAGLETTWRAVEASPVLASSLREASRSEAQALVATPPSLPLYDREVTLTQSELAERLERVQTLLDRHARRRALDERERTRLRTTRIVWAGVSVASLLLALFAVLRTSRALDAQASEFFDHLPLFAPDKAVDGKPETSWLLPSGQAGWLDVRPSAPRRVSKVRLLNTTNAPLQDRGTKNYRVELYLKEKLVGSFDGAFEWQEAPDVRVHPLAPIEVDRVRFVVTSWHRSGAGLAELSVE